MGFRALALEGGQNQAKMWSFGTAGRSGHHNSNTSGSCEDFVVALSVSTELDLTGIGVRVQGLGYPAS